MIIVHAIKRKDWEEAQKSRCYGQDSLEKWGFIHCSPIEYILLVANYNFKGMNDLLLLCIDEDKVTSEIKWEDYDGFGRFYPHIYGQLNLDAVIDVFEFPTNENGTFSFPGGIEKYKY